MTAKPVGPANGGAFIRRRWLGGKVIPDCFIVLTGFSGREWTNRWTAKKKQGGAALGHSALRPRNNFLMGVSLYSERFFEYLLSQIRRGRCVPQPGHLAPETYGNFRHPSESERGFR